MSLLRGLVELDRLAITVLVDNCSDGLSPPCASCDPRSAANAAKYTSEISHAVSEVAGGSAECLDFRRVAHAGHGLSLLLEAEAGGRTRTLLFDAGPSAELFRNNATAMELPAGAIEAAVLSHWHIDHSGGLPEAARLVEEARAAAGEAPPAAPVVFDLHPRRPVRRGLQLPGQIIPFNEEPDPASMQRPGGAVEVQLHSQPHLLLDGCFFVSGHIPRRTEYERGNPSHVSQWAEGGPWEPDEEVADERYIAVRVKGKGVVVFSACSHAGIVNVCRDAQAQAGEAPFGVFGGFHLAPSDLADRIGPTVRDLAALDPQLVVAGHCTGWRASAALSAALGGRFMPLAVGGRFSVAAAAAQ